MPLNVEGTICKFTSVRDCSEILARGGGWSFCWGVPISNKFSVGGGGPKFYGDSEGGFAFFTGTFPKNDHPPLREILNSP